ncbi:hypothetical protein NZD89_06080 [Alicyclobacillus fastidiosus]|uniref:Uncharacterized protein n=1 Tax=Alicyclobacillus fastidiosus TaxID=392011 RepID=A0ABY6ZKH8_9BACL|nr:hypothetical protein [Alicyclobacillus fastidiosus]WAH42982.1 hypothetical protein NZD89_06080 [Alicyclobacillus fastidiosus]GMA64950.1 hypothetical protein GCM10025859_53900 [Alicyclobacillus fastidiosus]
MRFIQLSLISVLTVLMVSGCSSQSHPNYSALKNVPKSQMDALKSAIKKSGLKNLELPTKVPFPLQDARIAHGENLNHNIDIFMGGGKQLEALEESAASVDANATLASVSGVICNTKLADGTKAYFSNNGSVTQLLWIKNGIFYDIPSSRAGANLAESKPDLSKSQLSGIANSFGYS